MARRTLSETGYYHIVTRSAGQVALFEDDADRRRYLRLLKEARDRHHVRVVAWVLMTDHVHLVVDTREDTAAISPFMHWIDSRYSRYFNARTGRAGTLFEGEFWSGSIANDAQLVATVHYVHMNPEAAGIAPMRQYHWSSYQEYAGMNWVVDTSLVIGYFGSFDAFDAYNGSPEDEVRSRRMSDAQDGDVLAHAMRLAGVSTSNDLRVLPKRRRNELIKTLAGQRIPGKVIARTFGIGPATVSRVLRS